MVLSGLSWDVLGIVHVNTCLWKGGCFGGASVLSRFGSLASALSSFGGRLHNSYPGEQGPSVCRYAAVADLCLLGLGSRHRVPQYCGGYRESFKKTASKKELSTSQ